MNKAELIDVAAEAAHVSKKHAAAVINAACKVPSFKVVKR